MFVTTFLLDTKHHNIEKYLHKIFWYSFFMKNNLIKQTNMNLSKLKCDIQYKNLISEYKKLKNLEITTKQDYNLIFLEMKYKQSYEKKIGKLN